MIQKVFDIEQKKGSGGQPEPKRQKLKIKGLNKILNPQQLREDSE
ncbi:MAG: hypothetical protein AAFN93_24150 [Bacteroidota bacterium]